MVRTMIAGEEIWPGEPVVIGEDGKAYVTEETRNRRIQKCRTAVVVEDCLSREDVVEPNHVAPAN